MTREDITIERSRVTGALNLSTIYNGYLVRCTYFDYSEEEAIEAFIYHCENSVTEGG